MSDRTLALSVFLAGALALATPALAQPSAPPAIAWPPAEWNPRPLPDDLVLPLPCGGGIAFRPVATPVPQGALADREATLGWSNSDTDYSEFLRRAFIRGGFPGPTPQSPPRYYIGKYEITNDQYGAVMNPQDCAGLPSASGRLPRANVAWHEATAFTSALSSWLAKSARDRLPKDGEALAFARLPTEEEWEYAARGGAEVGEVDFGAQVFPMPQGIQRYVWFQGTRSAGGAAHPIGELEPNPLGIFDILGNVAEWVIEPYRLNKVGRAHGLAGGTVARGGDFLTSEARIRSAMRVELPPLNVTTGETTKSPRVGLRPVLVRVSTTGDAQISAVQDAFKQESQSNATAAEDPLKLLEALGRQASDAATRTGLSKIEATLRTSNREIRDRESLAIRGLMQTATHLARQIVVEKALEEVVAQIADTQRRAIESQTQLINSQSKLAEGVRDENVRGALRQQEQYTRQISKSYETVERGMSAYAATIPDKVAALKAEYLRVIRLIAARSNPAAIGEEGSVVAQEFQAQQPRGRVLAELSKIAVTHMKAAAAGKPPAPDQVEKDLLAAAAAAQQPQRPAPR